MRHIRALWLVLSRSAFCNTETVQAVYFVFRQSRQIQNWQPNSDTKYCHSLQRNYQKKLQILELSPDFNDGWRRQTFSDEFYYPEDLETFEQRLKQVSSEDRRRFYQPTENWKHKQEDGYRYRYKHFFGGGGGGAWYNSSYTITAKPIKMLELHYPMIQFLISPVIT